MAVTEYIRNVDRAILNRSSRTQFGVSINVWRLAGDTLNLTCNFLYCNHQVHRDFLITLYNNKRSLSFGCCVCVDWIAVKMLSILTLNVLGHVMTDVLLQGLRKFIDSV
jgi:hypothetical protein